MNEKNAEQFVFHANDSMEEDELLKEQEQEQGSPNPNKIPKPDPNMMENHDNKLRPKTSRKPLFETKCSGVIIVADEKNQRTDLKLAKKLANMFIKASKEGHTQDEAKKEEKFSKFTTGREFENTEHLLKFMSSSFQPLVIKDINIRKADDGQIILTHLSRKRNSADPFMKTKVKYTEVNDKSKKIEICLEAHRRILHRPRRMFKEILDKNE